MGGMGGRILPTLSTCTNPLLKWNMLILCLFQLYEQFPGLLHNVFAWLFTEPSQTVSHFSWGVAEFEVVVALLDLSFVHGIIATCILYWFLCAWCDISTWSIWLFCVKWKSNKFVLHICIPGITAGNWLGLLARKLSHMSMKGSFTSHSKYFANAALVWVGKKLKSDTFWMYLVRIVYFYGWKKRFSWKYLKVF